MKRFVAIPFNVKISDDQIDPKLLNKFKFETCAIIYQALRAYINLKNNHYRFSGNFKLNGNSSSLTCNDGEHFIDEFINQNCIFNPDEFCSTNALFIEYCKFIKTFKLYCNIDIKGFSRKFKEICGTKIKDGKRNCSDLKNSGNGFWGVTLKTS